VTEPARTSPGTAPPWSAGSATGIGSLPGEDPLEACRLVFGELDRFPHLPELPGRGPGADIIGRTAALLVDLHVDLQPSGWRLIDRAGVDERRARDYLARDLDALEEVARDYAGPLKVQLGGPWTLAAALERPRGERPLADPGALRDVSASLAEGLAAHLREVAQRVPDATLCMQLDEPSLPAIRAGRIRRTTGRGTYAPPEDFAITEVLRTVMAAAVDAGAVPVVHCCADAPPLTLFADAGARAIAVDAARVGPRDDDVFGELIERGLSIWLGVVPGLGPGTPPPVRDVVAPVRELWRRLGFAPERLAETVVVTPACGLAGASIGWVRTALRLVRQAGQVLLEAPE
jgi:methionine synthase II (cobalamin-independent)